MFTLMVSVFVFLVIVSPLLILVIRYNGKRGQTDDASFKKMTPPEDAGATSEPGPVEKGPGHGDSGGDHGGH